MTTTSKVLRDFQTIRAQIYAVLPTLTLRQRMDLVADLESTLARAREIPDDPKPARRLSKKTTTTRRASAATTDESEARR